MKPVIVASVGRAVPALDALTAGERVEIQRVERLPGPVGLNPDRATVVLLDRSLLEGADESLLATLSHQAALVALGDPGEADPPESVPAALLSGYIASGATGASAQVAMHAALRHAAALLTARQAARLSERSACDVRELTSIGAALSTERNLLTLLTLILSQARRITAADAGSLYLVERADGGGDALRFKLAQNHTLPNLPFSEYTIPLDHTSVAGHAAATAEPLNIPDVYLLPDDVQYRQNRTFDERFGYRTRSMLVIPMRTHRDEVIGVLQLINRKRSAAARLTSVAVVEREVLPFDQRSVELVRALAAQAAVAIENSRLYEDIERLFEGFVTAAVTAIESRDPATSGHASRVATLTCALAETVDRLPDGPYGLLRFSREQLRELRYAGLLHDFGKVGVREEVLVKEKKLYPGNLATIQHRFRLLQQQADLQYERDRAEYLLAHGRDRYDEARGGLDRTRCAERDRLQRYLDAIVRADEPTVLRKESAEELAAIKACTFVDTDGVSKPLLSADELRYLMIDRGNLDDRERREIESHVTHTWRFLEHIPWTRELRAIPEIAYGHHEKLNGTGYPRQIRADAIPVETRMITIADIFDALTATDRPYKRAVPPERALDILRDEAREGALDQVLLDAFVDARVWNVLGPGALSA